MITSARFRLAAPVIAVILAACSDHLRLPDEYRPESFEKFVTGSLPTKAPGTEAPRIEYGPPNQGGGVARGYEGDGTGPNSKSGGATARPGSTPTNGLTKVDDGFRLTFNDVELAELSRLILGDTLKLPFAIDPSVKGTVTVDTGKPIAGNELIAMLEVLLDMNQFALVKQAGVYQVVSAADVKGKGAGTIEYAKEARSAGPGYGVTIMPLRHVSSTTLLNLLTSVSTRQGALGAITRGNLVVVRGTAPERRELLGLAEMLDVDWMKGRSAGIFPLVNATPDAVIEELEKILETNEGGRGRGQIRLQPIERLNAVMVLAETSDLLHDSATWIKRLDVTNNNALGYYVYRVENGKARDLAAVLNEAFGNGSAARRTTLSALAPGSRQFDTSSRSNGAYGSNGASASNGSYGSNGAYGANGSSAIPGLAGGSGTPNAADATLVGANSPLAQIDQPLPQPSTAVSEPQSGPPRQPGAQRIEQVRIVADEVNNKLLIYANGRNFRSIIGMLRSLDRVPTQVLINATLAEVTLNDNLRWGVQLYLRNHQQLTGGYSETGSLIPGPVLPGANLIFGLQVTPKVILDALAQETNVRVLSSPAVVVVNGQTARLQVGDEVPVTTRQATSVINPDSPTVNSIEFRDTGVILKVTPRINSAGLVTMEVQQEISAVVNTAVTLTPTISQRRIASTISVYDGHMVVLGGLISEARNETQDRLPIWEKIPLIGETPGRTDRALKRSELVVFIQPRVIRDPSDATGYSQDLRLALGQLAPETRAKYKRWRGPPEAEAEAEHEAPRHATAK